MAGPKDFSVRLPVAAGRFYPGDPQECRATAKSLLQPWEGPSSGSSPAAAALPAEAAVGASPGLGAGLPGRSGEHFPEAPASRFRPGVRGWGGIVPHAGWVCSGRIAGQALYELARLTQDSPPRVVVVFGAVHTPLGMDRAALDSHAAWRVPGGDCRTAIDIAGSLANRASSLFASDDRFHRQEHAVEVELPLIQAAWPEAEVLPIEVPLVDDAVAIGRETAQFVLSTWRSAVFLASSDLTHYGPAYRFAPAGVGPAGLAWAKQNDLRVLRLVMEGATDRIVKEVREHSNACGGGAIAAMMAACHDAGASHATLLRHASSYETLAGLTPDDPSNAVGYAGLVMT